MSDLTSLRTTLATSLEAAGRVVYSYPKEAIALPAIVLVPGSPYIEPDQSFGGRYRVNLDVTACVGANDNQTSLANLETLMLAVMAALPVTVDKQSWTTPNITEIGPQQALTSILSVQVHATI